MKLIPDEVIKEVVEALKSCRTSYGVDGWDAPEEQHYSSTKVAAALSRLQELEEVQPSPTRDSLARRLISSGPNAGRVRAPAPVAGEPAEFSRDDDGELLMDWSPRTGRMVSLSLRADGRLSYAITWDGEKSHGTAQMPAGEPVRMLTQPEVQAIFVAEHGPHRVSAADWRIVRELESVFCRINAGRTIPTEGSEKGDAS